MKHRWKQRRLALMTALMLALPALGMAEGAGEPIPSEPEQSEPVVYAEAVESAEEQGALELGDLPSGEADAPGEERAAEPADPGDEADPEATSNPEEAPATEEESDADDEGSADAASQGEAAPDADAGLMEGEADAEVVMAFSFPNAKLYMGKGEKRIFAARLPAGSEGATVTYASSKPSVVKVNGEGKLTARKKGTAKITATASTGETATCKVKVVKAPSKVKLSASSLVVGLEEGRALTGKLPSGSASAITWTSDDPGIATVDENGVVRGVAAGAVTITAATFNGRQARCAVTVLAGRAPAGVSLPAKTVKLGQWETYQIAPKLGEGEATRFTYASSKRKIASVSAEGLVTARQPGSATITVKTHNGLSCKLTVKVLDIPSEVTISQTSLTLEAGASAKLTASVNANTASEITWVSSNVDIATVDDAGNVTAVAPGAAEIVATTYNGLTAACALTVTEPKKENNDDPKPEPTPAEMIANLRASDALGGKKDAICKVAKLLMDAGYEPAFAAGVCANVYSEGTYGFFESSKYVKNYLKRPRYFCYLDGGDYYTLKNGEYVLTAVYLSQEEIDAYTGTAEARLRYGEEKYYWNHWSGKYVYNVDLNELQAFIDALTAGKWVGKFGLGITQWTGGRTRKLMAYYRKYAGEGNATITKEQVIAAENDMILYDLQGDYKKVYTSWKSENKGALNCTEAARSAGSIVCLKYEIPANKETSAVKRGNNAAKFYDIMVGAGK